MTETSRLTVVTRALRRLLPTDDETPKPDNYHVRILRRRIGYLERKIDSGADTYYDRVEVQALRTIISEAGYAEA